MALPQNTRHDIKANAIFETMLGRETKWLTGEQLKKGATLFAGRMGKYGA
jgi:hypothetical protein